MSAALRAEASHRSEMVSQLLFGETYSVVECADEWLKISTHDCAYEGWLPRKQHTPLTDEELELLRNLKKERADVLLMFNAMIAEFAGLPDAERMRVVINGKSYDWWREHLITALEFFDQMRDRVSNAGD